MNPRQLAKKERQAMRKLQKKLFDDDLPVWFLNPLNEVDEEEELKIQEAEMAALEQERLNQEVKKRTQEIALENEKAKKKTNEMQRKALKVICSFGPKKARAMRRRK